MGQVNQAPVSVLQGSTGGTPAYLPFALPSSSAGASAAVQGASASLQLPLSGLQTPAMPGVVATLVLRHPLVFPELCLKTASLSCFH